MKPSLKKRLIDPVDEDDIIAREARRCYNATTHVYYLNVNNRYSTSANLKNA
jgi:hypothetical protein